MNLTLNPIDFKSTRLSEIGQTIPTLFSFAKVNLDETVDRLHEWVKCRDFLGDVLVSNKYKKDFSIYGFNAGRVKRGENLELVVKFPSEAAETSFLSKYEKIMHPIEKMHGMELTQVKQFKNVKERTYLITGDKWWTNTISLLSLYTFLIKVCCYTAINPDDWMNTIPFGVEHNYIGTAERKNRMSYLLDNLKFIFSEFPSLSGWTEEANKNEYTIHDCSGFVSLFMNNVFKENFYSKKFFEGYNKK